MIEPITSLPDVALMYRDIIGLTALIKLAKWRGGRSVYVPYDPAQDSELVMAIGRDAATRLANIYGGTMIRPPKCMHYLIAVRNAEMHEKHYPSEGNNMPISLNNLACQYELTQSGVLYALKCHKKQAALSSVKAMPSPQQSLF